MNYFKENLYMNNNNQIIMQTFTVSSSKRNELIDISEQLKDIVSESKVDEGSTFFVVLPS